MTRLHDIEPLAGRRSPEEGLEQMRTKSADPDVQRVSAVQPDCDGTVERAHDPRQS
ncbi:hypothetical protein GCM10009609_33830 [Pseudonocardia aurantiaca]|uniref:Uncharacterized protein n=1 Tax=Pseudonocardia aurantiaca TaxID=75290 RepID=A0ABW4FRA0_9PSEU